jgi:hypothetical protein
MDDSHIISCCTVEAGKTSIDKRLSGHSNRDWIYLNTAGDICCEQSAGVTSVMQTTISALSGLGKLPSLPSLSVQKFPPDFIVPSGRESVHQTWVVRLTVNPVMLLRMR